MKLEPITQSEVSQNKKSRYCILTHIYGIQKAGTEEYVYRAAMETHTETDLEKGCEEEGEGEIKAESSKDVHTLTDANRWPKGICCMAQGIQTGAQQ